MVPSSRDDESEAPDAINKVRPSIFTIANATENVVKPEKIYVYLFNSEKDMNEGINFILPSIPAFIPPVKTYKQKNAFVVYYAYGGKVEKFGGVIQAAMNKLS
ncbi:hypothetical protein SAMN05428962_2738 [Paenibacillus sp. BC26]|nr:hypothetical protein SAMN05428962_2738 [Paenibacillus sp. BC26]